MKLSEFLTRLFSEGIVVVPRQLVDFDEADLAASAQLIVKYNQVVRLDAPAHAPELNTVASLWAAQYLFHAVQLVLLREVDADLIPVYLPAYSGEPDASAIYSVDLLFRHLAPLFQFGSGISPDDPLVTALKTTASLWPYSSVGLKIAPLTDTTVILADPCLRVIYLDRIIFHQEKTRLSGLAEITALNEITGIHHEIFWPGLEPAHLKIN